MTISKALTSAYNVLLDFDHSTSSSYISDNQIPDGKNDHSSTKVENVRDQFNAITDTYEQAEFVVNLALHSDKTLCKLGIELLKQQIDLGSVDTLPIWQQAASIALTGWENKTGKLCSLSDQGHVEAIVPLWALARPFDRSREPGQYQIKNHQVNGLLSHSINKLEPSITEYDAHQALQPGNFISYNLLLKGLNDISNKQPNTQSLTTAVYVTHVPNESQLKSSHEVNMPTLNHIDVASHAMKNLSEGEKLLIPIHYHHHFGSLELTKTNTGFDVTVFDSKNTDKDIYLHILNALKISDEIENTHWCTGNFQSQNDCAIHVYEFYKFCTMNAQRTPPSNFEDYKSIIMLQNTNENGIDESQCASALRRQNFVMDLCCP